MQETICAKVSTRLLSKANRLFTGSMDGRIIEILQNARRAGATEVRIKNKDEYVIIEDNGSGIKDFQKLLDLGSSGWDEELEAGEDPAGVGLFCLAPRGVNITSGNRTVIIKESGWTGEAVEVKRVIKPVEGTVLKFKDDGCWDLDTVEKHAVFCGMRVIVDGKYCHSMQFCSCDAADYADLGCKIEVASEISKYHRQWMSGYYQNKVQVNFHGQIVELDHWHGKTGNGIHLLVDLTEQTQIRLMLPARTKLVENDSLQKLKEAIEIEYYRYFQRQKEHTLHYDEYLRARELGIELPEAKPQYILGLIDDGYDMAAEIFPPKDFKLSDGYLCFGKDLDDEFEQANVHLLAALGEFKEKPFVPVSIRSGYMGYSWADLPRVTSVKVSAGKERLRRMICAYDLVCVESLSITVATSDGREFVSDVSMAMLNEPPKGKSTWRNDAVYITQAAFREMNYSNIWHQLGSFNEEGDSYDTQQDYIEEELNRFWSDLIGPFEQLRGDLVRCINRHSTIFGKWQKVVVEENGTVRIVYKDGKNEIINRPPDN